MTYSFPNMVPSCHSIFSSNSCFLTCIQISQEAGKVVWYSHLFQNFPQFDVIHTVKCFGIVNKAEVDVFWNSLAFSMIQQMLAIWSLVPLPLIDIPAPGDGTLTIQLNGTDVQTFTANQSGNATANIVTPAVNDGTLTIMVDGITAGTFTANQSTDTIVALTSGGGGSADVQPMSKSIAHSIAASVFGA